MAETNNLAPPCAVNQTLPQVLGRFSNLPHAAPGLKLKSAKLLLQKSTKEAPTIIYTDWSLLLQNKYLEPIVTVSDYHTSYVTRHNHQVGFLAACNLELEKIFLLSCMFALSHAIIQKEQILILKETKGLHGWQCFN